jgi:hypothetical protein
MNHSAVGWCHDLMARYARTWRSLSEVAKDDAERELVRALDDGLRSEISRLDARRESQIATLMRERPRTIKEVNSSSGDVPRPALSARLRLCKGHTRNGRGRRRSWSLPSSTVHLKRDFRCTPVINRRSSRYGTTYPSPCEKYGCPFLSAKPGTRWSWSTPNC